MTNSDIPTVEEYLQLIDFKGWKLVIQVEEWRHGEFFWLRSPHIGSVLPTEQIDLPTKPFGVVVAYRDRSEGGVSIYANKSEWSVVENLIALSAFSNSLPELDHFVPNAHLIIDESVSDAKLFELCPRLFKGAVYGEPDSLATMEDQGNPDFWNAIESIRPYCYYSYGLCREEFTFVARGRTLYKMLLERFPLKAIEERNLDEVRRAS